MLREEKKSAFTAPLLSSLLAHNLGTLLRNFKLLFQSFL